MTTAPAVDERKHRDVWVAGVAGVQVFEPGMVPGLDGNAKRDSHDPPRFHALIFLSRRPAPVSNTSARPTRSGWRATIRATGRTPDEVRHVETKATAIEGTRLNIDAADSTPVTHEFTDDEIKKTDDGWFFRDTSFTYVL